MAVVAFNCAEFKALYPQFDDFTDERLLHCFDLAQLALDNTQSSLVPHQPGGVSVRKTLLLLLVCHLCELWIRGNSQVGTLDKASQGNVSVSFSPPRTPGPDWYQQSQCGATAWQLLTNFASGGRLYNG